MTLNYADHAQRAVDQVHDGLSTLALILKRSGDAPTHVLDQLDNLRADLDALLTKLGKPAPKPSDG